MNLFLKIIVLVLLHCIPYYICENLNIQSLLKDHCPTISSSSILENYALKGKQDAGTYTLYSNGNNLASCIEKCCNSSSCNLLLIHDSNCIGVNCASAENCEPVPANLTTIIQFKDFDILKASLRIGIKNESSTNSTKLLKRCETGLMQCGQNEICITLNNRRRDGFCQCKEDFIIDDVTGNCEKKNVNISNYIPTTISTIDLSTALNSTFNVSTASTIAPTTTPHKVEKLVVSITNKTVQLQPGVDVYPDKVTLSAYAIGADHCNFEWTLLHQPDSDVAGSVSDPNTETITLSQLVPGVYVFRVTVEAPGAYGEATGNVTVVPAMNINKPPLAIIVPQQQVVKLPNSGVILDGSGSTDDGTIESYRWEIVTGPLGYKLNDESGHTLKLEKLIPGNYTIMLKVTDDKNLEGNSTAIVSVIKETDYPPSANAGGDQIIYLPVTQTILNGNASTDDHGIIEWEWTKGPEDSGKAVDMQDTRTPYLKLSNLKQGHYHFMLKVTDNAKQSAISSAHVYVHEPNHATPIANVTSSLSITLPNTTVVLDGSNTASQYPQINYLWTQLSGPNTATIENNESIKTNATGLTKGTYIFQLMVWLDEDKVHNTTANVTVNVLQNKNLPPKANAGGDFSVTLPASVVLVNGSSSSDDVKITKWLWERDPTSLAAGTIINNSNTSSILMLTDVVSGRYVWKLTVFDDQGASSADTVSIIVKEGPNYLDEVEVVISIDIRMLTESQLSTLLQKLQLLLHTTSNDVSFQLISMYSLPRSGKVSLIILGYMGGKVFKGTEMAAQLREQVAADSDNKILDLQILSVDTVICQNNCSGHGECIQSSRNCRCHSWWMESFFRRHLGDGLANCDWSVVYVFVISVVGVLVSSIFGWFTSVLIVRRTGQTTHKKMRQQPRYSLLDTHDDNIKTRPRHLLVDSGSGTDSESEALFDAGKIRSKMDKQKNGYLKLHRIRT